MGEGGSGGGGEGGVGRRQAFIKLKEFSLPPLRDRDDPSLKCNSASSSTRLPFLTV